MTGRRLVALSGSSLQLRRKSGCFVPQHDRLEACTVQRYPCARFLPLAVEPIPDRRVDRDQCVEVAIGYSAACAFEVRGVHQVAAAVAVAVDSEGMAELMRGCGFDV